ncbi:Major facilitator superfamily domain, general substrate transporter [Ophiocordyceps sinensis CO18]|uniref:Major facilitator superfamily domain, general substrate transporter n=1 Tax=Ophiocordyceps sinensis (strain Co18 / CGMCC 3.14243) TaxID=911162 RepID=T5A7I1_OPHSC|nr:Major facilitator superfamily domain, general substrate transporter [Ophiocordyceps sinensis CO18]
MERSTPAAMERSTPTAMKTPVDRSASSEVDKHANLSSTTPLKRQDDAALEASEKASDSPRPIRGVKWFLVVLSLLASFLLYALDTTIVATIQPAIVNAFGRVDLVPWLGVSFALASAASTLPWSKAFGTFSAKKLFIGGTALFMGASALCGAAPSIDAFIVGRALAGIGGTGMYMGLLTILSVNTSDTERPRYLSLTGFWWGIGTVLGPVVGGAFAESPATWRWAFYLNLCVGAVVAPVYFVVLPDYHPLPGVPLRARLLMLDYLGALLSSATFLCIMMAMNFGGILWSWGDGRSIALFVLSAVLCAVFCLQQIYTIGTSLDNRIFPMHFFKNRTLVVLFLAMMFAAFGCFISIYYLPLYFQFTRGATALQTSVHMLPFILFLSASVLINGQYMGKTGYYYPWYIFGSALHLIGGALLYTVDETTADAKVYGYTILLGVGVGCYCQAGFPVAQMKVAAKDMASSVGFMTVSQMLGIAVGTGMSGAIYVNTASQGLERLFPDATRQEISSALAGVGSNLITSAGPGVAAAAEIA